MFNCTSHFFFYEAPCGWFYVVVFDPFGLEFSQVLCMVIDMGLFSFFYMLISSYVITICWKYFLFSTLYFLFLCQKSCVHRCVAWYLGLIFNSINPPVMPMKLYCSSVVEFEVRGCDASGSSLHQPHIRQRADLQNIF